MTLRRFALEVLSCSRLKKPLCLGQPNSRNGALLPPLEVIKALEGVTVLGSSYPIPPHIAELNVIDHQPTSVISPEQSSRNATYALCIHSSLFFFMDGTEFVYVLLIRKK